MSTQVSTLAPYHQGQQDLDFPDQTPTPNLRGKSVLITGGASGLGKIYAEHFVSAGAFVTICDLNDKQGEAVVQSLGGTTKAQFFHCDVLDWDQQVEAFERAIKNSPENSIDYAVANAGILAADSVFSLEDPNGPPVKPNLAVLDISLRGVIYTCKLAIHYFRRQPLNESRDRCLVITSSAAANIDIPGSPQYNTAKHGTRGLMRCLRWTTPRESIRINNICPWFARTAVMDDSTFEYLTGLGVPFVDLQDCGKAMMYIASEKQLSGRAIYAVPRAFAPTGLMDLGLDNYKAGSQLHEWQEILLKTAEQLVK